MPLSTNRRGFLGMFGAAAVAGPKVVEANLSHILEAPTGGFSVGSTLIGMQPLAPPDLIDSTATKGSYFVSQLKSLLGKTREQKDREKQTVQVYQLDPNVSTLRSASMTAKIRMSRDHLYERSLVQEQSRLEGIINGWW